MDTPSLLIAAAAAALALLAGWLLRVRPLAAERDSLRDKVHEEQKARAAHATEVAMLQEQIAASRSIEAERNRLAADLAALNARLEAREAAFAAEAARTRETFETLARQTLDAAQTQFLERAQARFAEHASASEASLRALLQPMTESLTRYEGEIRKIETARVEAFGSIREAVEAVRTGQEQVRTEAARLVGALRASPKARGRWGEQQLKNVLEMAGLAEHVDFAREVSTDTEDGRLRPDVIVRLPGGRQLVIDAKCAMNAYLDACDATDETARMAALQVHARALRTHAESLGRKAYWDQFEGTADYVLMFIPGEQFLSGALEADAGLWEFAFERKVLLATPTNLVAIARTVAMVWRQERMAEDAARVAELARELYARLAAMGGHVEQLGERLGKAVASYNNFVGSLETKVMPQGRKFLELSVDPGARALPVLEPLETAVREPRRDRDLSFGDAAE